jgi:hypothetical protein
MVFSTFTTTVWDFLTSPEFYFRSLLTHPNYWIVPLIISSLGRVVLAYFFHPFTIRAAMLHMVKGIQGAKQAEAMKIVGTRPRTRSLLMSSLPLLLKTALGAVLLTVLAKLIAGHGRLIQMFALTSYLSVFSLLRPLHVMTALRVRGIDNIRQRSDLDVRVGVSFLFPASTGGFSRLLDSINIYEILILWLAVMGVGTLCECSRGAAALIVSIYWVLGLAFKIAAVVIGSYMTAGRARSFLWAKSLLQWLGLWNRLSARLSGFKYLDAIGMGLPRDGNRCGPAAMQLILQQNGMDVSFESLEREMMDCPQGTSMRRMKEVAERHGFRTVAKRIGLVDVARIPLPSIALFRHRHYVVVQGIAADASLTIIDPSIGRCQVAASQFLEDCNGEMLLIWRSA